MQIISLTEKIWEGINVEEMTTEEGEPALKPDIILIMGFCGCGCCHGFICSGGEMPRPF